MFLVGYDLDRELVLARNSFGTDWGDSGHCWIPLDYVRSDFLDMWIFDIDITTTPVRL
jgi:C1A family cysteine protease